MQLFILDNYKTRFYILLKIVGFLLGFC